MTYRLLALCLFLATLSIAAAPSDYPPPDASITVHVCEAVRDACGPGTVGVAGQTICFYDFYENRCRMTDEAGNVTMLVRSGDVSVRMDPTVGWECMTPRGWWYCSSVVTVAKYEARVIVWGAQFSGWRLWLPLGGMAKG